MARPERSDADDGEAPDVLADFDSGDGRAPGFAPDEPTDDRKLGEWKTRYPSEARAAIRLEAFLVWLFLAISILLILAVTTESVGLLALVKSKPWLAVSPFVLAFAGGMLGGTLFTMKWLYHSVAKGLWNRDRRLWRVFTPFLSAGASLAIILLCASGALPFFGPELVKTNIGALGLSIVFGYFSDRAFSALERLAEDNLGWSKKKDKPSSRETA